MNIKLIILSFFLLSITDVFGQDFYSVIAENGLVIRDKPNLNAERIGKFYCGEAVKLIEKTDIRLQVNDHNTSISGAWFLVTSKSGLKGYVFSGYLLKKEHQWNIGVTCDSNLLVCSTTFSTKKNDFEIFNFQIEGQETKKDTLLLYEAVFNEIGDKLLKIKPKKDLKKIEVYYTRMETLNEWGSTKNSDSIIPKWKGNKPFIKLEATNNIFYRIPITDYENIRESTAKQMNLERSPDWDHVGEGWWIPRYQYKGIIAPYEIKSILLKIITTDLNHKTETKYIEIGLSYGC
ncbi:SH3 domain-containing protein [uncultured Kordia sp.]|uniref:SH3 domain-containing protein n=1 Tax=uncultured Kordia sp. TaxID=507699 RepID=UPI002626407B|nr:SH3 domain-containing protein [uncultured Kordia sp.]